MFNQELGNRVQLLFRDCQVLDAAAMAVPAFVSAALHRDRRQRLRVGDRSLVVRPASASEPDVLLPLARVHADGDAELFPAPGDELLCLAADDAPPGRRTGWVRLAAIGDPAAPARSHQCGRCWRPTAGCASLPWSLRRSVS